MWIIRAGARLLSSGSASRASGRRSCSTVTKHRSASFTPAWICAKTSDRRAYEGKGHPLRQAALNRQWSRSAGAAGLGCPASSVRSQPGEIHAPHDRHDGPDFFVTGAAGDTVAKNQRLELDYLLPAHTGALCLLLRLLAFLDLLRAGPVV